MLKGRASRDSRYEEKVRRKLGSTELTEHDRKLLSYMWEHRFHRENKLVFSDKFRENLKGSVKGYTRLNKTIASLNTRLHGILEESTLTVGSEPVPGELKRTYKVNPSFWKQFNVRRGDPRMQLSAFRFSTYTKGKRYYGICRDVKEMIEAGFTNEDIWDRCASKVMKGSQLAEGACSTDTREIDHWIQYWQHRLKTALGKAGTP